MKEYFVIFYVLLFFTPIMEAADWGMSDEKYFNDPLNAVKEETDAFGSEKRSVDLPGRVSVIHTHEAGKVSTFKLDKNGKGAVMCMREIFLNN